MKILVILALCSTLAAAKPWMLDTVVDRNFVGDTILHDDVYFKLGRVLYDVGVRFGLIDYFDILGVDTVTDFKVLGMKFYDVFNKKLRVLDDYVKVKILDDRKLLTKFILDHVFKFDKVYDLEDVYFKGFHRIVDMVVVLKTNDMLTNHMVDRDIFSNDHTVRDVLTRDSLLKRIMLNDIGTDRNVNLRDHILRDQVLNNVLFDKDVRFRDDIVKNNMLKDIVTKDTIKDIFLRDVVRGRDVNRRDDIVKNIIMRDMVTKDNVLKDLIYKNVVTDTDDTWRDHILKKLMLKDFITKDVILNDVMRHNVDDDRNVILKDIMLRNILHTDTDKYDRLNSRNFWDTTGRNNYFDRFDTWRQHRKYDFLDNRMDKFNYLDRNTIGDTIRTIY